MREKTTITIQGSQFSMPSDISSKEINLLNNPSSQDNCKLISKIMQLGISDLYSTGANESNQSGESNTNSQKADYERAHYKDYAAGAADAKLIYAQLPKNQGEIFFTNRLCLLEFIGEERFILTPKDNNEDLYTGIIFELSESNKLLLKCINLHDQIVKAGHTSGKVMLYAKVAEDAKVGEGTVKVCSIMGKTHKKKIIFFSLLSSFSFVAYATKAKISEFVSSKGWGDKQDLINNVALALLILGSLISLSLVIYAGKQHFHHSVSIQPYQANRAVTEDKIKEEIKAKLILPAKHTDIEFSGVASKVKRFTWD